MHVFITAHDRRYEDRYAAFQAEQRARHPKVRVHVLFSTPAPAGGTAYPDQHDLIDNAAARAIDAADSAGEVEQRAVNDRLAKFADRVPLSLIRGEMRYVQKLATPAMLAHEQLSIVEGLDKFFALFPPDVVFVSSGTNILHTTAYHMAKAADARVYRVHSYLNLNLDHKGARVWFCSNNNMRLSDDPLDHFSYSPGAISTHVETVVSGIEQRSFRLDEISKRYRARRLPISGRMLAHDVGRYVYHRSPFQKGGRAGRLAAHRHGDRLRVLVNELRNRSLTVPAAKLPKPYLLFALNTPYDSQILVRAPQYKDFLSLIELIAGMLPHGMHLALREHPAFPGMLDHLRLSGLMKRQPAVVLPTADVSLPDLIRGAQAVLTINNTAFVDAILLGKPIISLGKGYYSGEDLTTEVNDLQDLEIRLAQLVAGQLPVAPRARLVAVMERLFRETTPGPQEVITDKTQVILDGIAARLDVLALAKPPSREHDSDDDHDGAQAAGLEAQSERTGSGSQIREALG